MGWFSVTTLLSGICLAYVAHSIWTIFNIYHIPQCDDTVSQCLHPWLFKMAKDGRYINQDVSLVLYGSRTTTVTEGTKVDLLYSNSSFDVFSSHEISVNVSLSQKSLKDGVYFLHMFVVPTNHKPLSRSPKIAHSYTKLTQLSTPKPEAFSLMGGSAKNKTGASAKPLSDVPVPHWRSRVTVSVMTEDISFDRNNFPREIISFVKDRIDWSSMSYYPVALIDKLSFRIRDLQLLKEDKEEMPLTIIYQPMSGGKLRFWETISLSFDQLKSYGFGEKDVDEVKGIFADTNFYLLCLTFVVSAVHILFDALAFKNDISYWRKRKTMVGLSSRAVVWRCVSSIIIFFYLMDSDTSLLVTIPSGISAVIEVWKLKKAFKITFSLSGRFINFGDTSDKEKETEQFDAKAMSYLSYLLYPLILAGAVYSLIYVPHKSWWSWCLQSLVYGIYAFGFLFMLPQLFVNYKLKSVAHLPWRAFMYKAFNTFIDDVFAFIVTMPTAHRMACFRDDLVFIIYLYQRWLYPVDKTRVNEYGQSFDDEGSSPTTEGDNSKQKTE